MGNIAKSSMALLLVVCVLSRGGSGYSVLTHEEIVDLLWGEQIKPLLLQKYPGASEDDLRAVRNREWVPKYLLSSLSSFPRLAPSRQSASKCRARAPKRCI